MGSEVVFGPGYIVWTHIHIFKARGPMPSVLGVRNTVSRSRKFSTIDVSSSKNKSPISDFSKVPGPFRIKDSFLELFLNGIKRKDNYFS